jgi:hypothetical protein
VHDRPNQFDVDAHVVVDDLVPHTRNPPPRNAWRRIAHLGRKVLDGLTDDLDSSDDRGLQLLTLAESPEVDAPHVAAHKIDALQNVGQVQRRVAVLHRIRNSSWRTRPRRWGWSARHVVA